LSNKFYDRRTGTYRDIVSNHDFLFDPTEAVNSITQSIENYKEEEKVLTASLSTLIEKIRKSLFDELNGSICINEQELLKLDTEYQKLCQENIRLSDRQEQIEIDREKDLAFKKKTN